MYILFDFAVFMVGCPGFLLVTSVRKVAKLNH